MTLYHVTYLFNLTGIAKYGLQPGAGQNFSEGYRGHAAGWLFLTEADGVSYWMSKLEEHAEANTDHPEEGWVPVALRFEAEGLELLKDELGTRDSGSEAWKTKGSIAARDIEYWSGGPEWLPIDEVNESILEELQEEVLEASEQECDDDDPDYCWWIMDYEYFLPPDEELED